MHGRLSTLAYLRGGGAGCPPPPCVGSKGGPAKSFFHFNIRRFFYFVVNFSTIYLPINIKIVLAALAADHDGLKWPIFGEFLPSKHRNFSIGACGGVVWVNRSQ